MFDVRLVQVVDKALRDAKLDIHGVALVGEDKPQAMTTYHKIPQNIGQSFIRIDWQREPLVSELRKADTALKKIDFESLSAEKEEMTPDEVYYQLRQLPESMQRQVILRAVARMLLIDKGLADEVGVEITR